MFAIAYKKRILHKGFICIQCGALIPDDFEGLGWVPDIYRCKACLWKDPEYWGLKDQLENGGSEHSSE